VVPFTVFYKAEDYHQDYYELNKEEPYCKMVIQPKMAKFEKLFKDRLKKNN
jgi:peptide methionine sulfoxide reductase MsrA